MDADALAVGSAGGGGSAAGERLLRAFARRLPAEPDAALARLRRERVPVAVVAALAGDVPGALAASAVWRSAAEADRQRAERLRRAAAIVEVALAGIGGLAIAADTLGWSWSSDLDVFATAGALGTASAALRDAGGIELDALTGLLAPGRRRPTAPARHFALLRAGAVLAPVELSTVLWDRGEPAAPAIERGLPGDGGLPHLLGRDATRRRVAKLAATRRPTLRGAVELSALIDRGEALETAAMSASALRRHAPVERALGPPGPLSAAAERTRPRVNGAWAGARTQALRREAAARARPRQVRIGFCGIDGAGKSTQAARLVENLERSGVGARASWTRLGNRASGPVEALARTAQRLLPTGTHSFQATREAAGRRAPAGDPQGPPQPPGIALPLTRRGPVGWSWALAVTLDYLVRSRRAQRRASGSVLVLDRAVSDALVELQDDYGIALRLGLQRRLLARFAPRPHTTFYLRLPGSVAKARKDDVFTAAELEVQIRRYDALLETQPGVVVLEAQRPRDELAEAVLRAVCGWGSGRPVAGP